jgi:hypothetical protein
MAEIEEVAGGEVAAELVVAGGGGADPVGAQRQDVRDLVGPELRREVVVESGGGQDEAVHALTKQALGGRALRVRVVVGGGDDREARSLGAGAGDLLEQDRHHGVGEPGHQHTDGARVLPAQPGGVDVTAITELLCRLADALGSRRA